MGIWKPDEVRRLRTRRRDSRLPRFRDETVECGSGRGGHEDRSREWKGCRLRVRLGHCSLRSRGMERWSVLRYAIDDNLEDWYNLEKSKRVKAFRCGEFDACIEKAEATQGTLVKKREKYARREDAILHALELERKQLASYQTQGFRPESHGNSSACTKHHKDLGSTRYKSKKSKKRKDASVPSNVKKESEHCLHHAGSKRKFSESLAPVNAVNTHTSDFTNVRAATSGSKEKNIIVKKSKSDGSDFEDSFVSNSDRRRPLSQVFETNKELPHRLKQNGDYESCLIGDNNDSSLATFRSRRSRYTYMPSDSGETHSHSDVPSLQMTSAGADLETESNLQNSGAFSEEHTSSDFEKRGTESSERQVSESETEDDAELLRSANVILPLESCAPDLYSLPVSDKFRHMDYDDTMR
ncbi:hypothetical protein PR202_ga02401 [Eleusine coracana subsp. coracana]|uniref:Uncharacterized protein n=1 Tax=Eleusine coracana subsp. coracana TaxID=191504 RepID=A0AAV5BJN4_ELECO|nr:hypothetical protein PR202_ga02401 [Eleusine coracana subsp. coracana]